MCIYTTVYMCTHVTPMVAFAPILTREENGCAHVTRVRPGTTLIVGDRTTSSFSQVGLFNNCLLIFSRAQQFFFQGSGQQS